MAMLLCVCVQVSFLFETTPVGLAFNIMSVIDVSASD